MRKAADYYASKVAVHGGYVYYYSPDLSKRYGEGPAGTTMVWVQPPGTPTVGLALVKAYAATGDQFYLDAATKAGEALIYGQLTSGGWQNCVEFDPTSKRVYLYRNGNGRGQNNSTLDDDITESAIRFMAHLDRAHDFKHEKIHESVTIALEALLAAQYPNGAFPQVWTGPVASQPVVKPSFPDYDWRTEGRVKNYWDMYTLNDNIAGNVTKTLIDAYAIYKDERFKQALVKLGDFLILAQMPDPQPAWAQQYDYQMRPIWARKFEPPAISGGESQDVMEALLAINEATGDKKYLAPIPKAIEWLRSVQLPDGRLSRYYELKTNKPLYMNREGEKYFLTHSDKDLPSHYGWKRDSRLDAIEAEWKFRRHGKEKPGDDVVDVDAAVRKIVADLDGEGRWITIFAGEPLAGQPKFKPGDQYLNSGVFSANLEMLSDYLSISK